MPILANSKHEAFARGIVAGLNQRQSAIHAGISEKTAHNVGSRLRHQTDVAARIEELVSLQSPAEQNGQKQSKEWVETQLVHLVRLTKEREQFAVTRSCLELLARLNGYLVEKRESTATRVNIHAMHATQLNAALRQALGDIPAAERKRLLAAVPADVVDVIAEAVTDGECSPEDAAVELVPDEAVDTTTSCGVDITDPAFATNAL